MWTGSLDDYDAKILVLPYSLSLVEVVIRYGSEDCFIEAIVVNGVIIQTREEMGENDECGALKTVATPATKT